MPAKPGTLYVVATPIGNLDDITTRALDTLREVDLIAAEDTRHSKRLLNHFRIDTPLLSLHEHNERARIPRLIDELRSGKAIALITDAGTPLISDPGFVLVRSLHEQGLSVTPVPGPSSILAALSVAGLPTDRFAFEGFLPAKPGARLSHLATLKQETRTLIFLESSHRIQDSLAAMAEVFGGERRAVVARELTKVFEEIHGDTLSGLCQWLAADDNRGKGEFVVMIHGAPTVSGQAIDPETERLLAVLLEELPVKRAAAVATKVTGIKKNTLYQMALRIVNPDIAHNKSDQNSE